jgi:hypothetical protein
MDYDPVGYQQLIHYLIAKRRRRKRRRQIQVKKVPGGIPNPDSPPKIQIAFPDSIFDGTGRFDDGAVFTLTPFLDLYFEDEQVCVKHCLSLGFELKMEFEDHF